jgi:sialic acid synthase
MRELQIGNRRIADDAPAFVIAELGGNHGGNVQTACALIQKSAQAGVSAVKFQLRDNATLYTRALLNAPYASEHAYGPTYGAHREALELGYPQLCTCWTEARKQGVDAFATAFDEPSLKRLGDLGVPAVKIHSGGLTDHALITAARSLNVPILLSTGGGDLVDIDRAVGWLGDTPHALLHCTASYPLQPEDANLRVILTLRQRYPETVIGFSSHAPGIAWSLVAYAFGARIIEHHVTLDRSSKGTDQAFSLEPKGLSTLVEDLEKLRIALGDGIKRFLPSEIGPIHKMRRWWLRGKWQICTEQERDAEIHA